MKFLCFLLMLPLLSVGQAVGDRVNASLPKISQPISTSLTAATGWMRNPNGEWISRPNRIPVSLDNSYKSLLDYEKYSTGVDNFVSLQLRKFTVGDSTYAILIKRVKTGYYRYEAIEEEWVPTQTAYYSIFSMADLSQFKKLASDSLHQIEILLASSGRVNYNAETYINDIAKDQAKFKDLRTDADWVKLGMSEALLVTIAPLKSKQVVRFQLYSENRSRYLGALRNDGKFEQELKPFDECYFECDYPAFNSFIKLE